MTSSSTSSMASRTQPTGLSRRNVHASLGVCVFVSAMATALTLSLFYLEWVYGWLEVTSSTSSVVDTLLGVSTWMFLMAFAVHTGAVGRVPWLRTMNGIATGCAAFLAAWVPLAVEPVFRGPHAYLCLPAQTLIALDVAPFVGVAVAVVTIIGMLRSRRGFQIAALTLGVSATFLFWIASELIRYTIGCGTIS
jgi:hypothetical protein